MRVYGVMVMGVVGALGCRGDAKVPAAAKAPAVVATAPDAEARAPVQGMPPAQGAKAQAEEAAPAAPATAPTAPTAPAARSSSASLPPVAATFSAPGEAAPAVEPTVLEGGQPVPDALARRIRYQLRELSPAPIALREAALLPSKGGGAEVVGFAEYSVYEDCVRNVGGSRKDARDQCLPEITEVGYPYENSETKRVRLNRNCNRYALFYAKVAAAPDLAKGALTVEHELLGEEDCELIDLKDVRLGDLDRDGRRELAIDMVFGMEAQGDTRSGDDLIDKATQRYAWVFEVKPAWRVQLELPIGVRRVSANAEAHWVDLNGDRRLDLVQVVDCDGRGGGGGHNEECDEPLRERIWYLYDRELDTWRNPYAPPQDAADVGTSADEAAPPSSAPPPGGDVPPSAPAPQRSGNAAPAAPGSQP